jgi:hypothetical protein
MLRAHRHIETKTFRTISFLLVFLFVFSVFAWGQPVLTVVCRNDVSLGTINSGSTQRVQAVSASAAKFEVHSTKELDILIQFVLPPRLSHTQGVSNVELRFEPDCARWSTVNNAASATAFDPQVPLKIHMNADQTLYLWIGTIASTPPRSQAGRYSGNITCTVQAITQ